MPVYQVTPLSRNARELEGAVRKNLEEGDCFQLANDAGWLVTFKGTSKELCDRLGIDNRPVGDPAILKVGSAIVVPVTSYYGLGPTDMWEWLKTRIEAGA